MPRVNLKKTKSAPKRNLVVATVVLLAVVVLAGGFYWTQRPKTAASGPSQLVVAKGTPAEHTYKLERVSTPQAQQKGLSGRTGLAKDSGMVFPYQDPTEHCMWMKDMRFDIDIVWVDASNRITSIVANLRPSTYPQKYCAVSKNVIELPAGSARAEGLRVGQIVEL